MLTSRALVAIAAIVLGVLTIGGGSGESTHTVTEGHSSLAEGGLKLAEHRPLYGYGSASFSKAFAEAEDVKPGETTISHTEPVTVAAEQGAIGVIPYAVLLWVPVQLVRREARAGDDPEALGAVAGFAWGLLLAAAGLWALWLTIVTLGL